MSERIDTNETTTDSSAEYTDGCQAAPGKRVRASGLEKGRYMFVAKTAQMGQRTPQIGF